MVRTRAVTVKSVPIKTCRFLSYLLQWIMINHLGVECSKDKDSVKRKCLFIYLFILLMLYSTSAEGL